MQNTGPFRVFIVIIVIAIAAVIVFGIIKVARDRAAYSKAPRVSVKAQVLSMREYPDYHPQDIISHNAYYVDFRTKSGERIGFKLNASQYEKLKVGKTGRLVYKGDRFLDFE